MRAAHHQNEDCAREPVDGHLRRRVDTPAQGQPDARRPARRRWTVGRALEFNAPKYRAGTDPVADFRKTAQQMVGGLGSRKHRPCRPVTMPHGRLLRDRFADQDRQKATKCALRSRRTPDLVRSACGEAARGWSNYWPGYSIENIDPGLNSPSGSSAFLIVRCTAKPIGPISSAR